jgi:poly(beta-D-mannuronate) lyase
VPKNTVVENNLFYHSEKENLFTIYDDISGISFAGNVMSPNMEPFQEEGFETRAIQFARNEDGLLLPTTAIDAGMQPAGERATPENTGVSWYPREEQEQFFNTGKVIPVKAGENTLVEALKNSDSGDIIELTEAGEYLMSKSIDIYHPISFVAAASLTEKPVLKFEKTSLFNIEN